MKKLWLSLLLALPVTLTVAAPTDITLKEFFWSAPTKNVDGTPLTDLAGFKIYCRTETGNYPPQGHDVPDPNIQVFPLDQVINLNVDEHYFCTITAYDTQGIESAYGPEIDFLSKGGQAVKNVNVPVAPPEFSVR